MLTRPLCNSEPTHHPPRGGWFDSWIDVTAAIAEGKRPATFRTRKLSPPAPMVLHPRECGRVGRRRTTTLLWGTRFIGCPKVVPEVLSDDVPIVAEPGRSRLGRCHGRSRTR